MFQQVGFLSSPRLKNSNLYYRQDIKLEMSEIQVGDIEQAKLLLSMKNDQITSLTNKMKMIQKKSNIKIAESNYQIQQQKNRFADLEKKMEKIKESQVSQLAKFSGIEDKLKMEIAKLKQGMSELQKNQRISERSHKAQLYEQQLILNEEKEKRYKLNKQMNDILKLFNPKEIVAALNLASVDSITPYLKLYEELKSKNEEVAILTHHLEQYKSDTLQAIEESFSKLSSYQQVMKSLRQKNQELQFIMEEKERNLEEKDIELVHKSSILTQIEAFTTEKYSEMNQQIQTLRKSVQNYERQSQNYQESKNEHEENLKFIFELSSEFEKKEEDYLNKINELEVNFHCIQKEKEEIQRDYERNVYKYKEEIKNYQSLLERAEKNVKDKEDIVSMLANSLRELEGQFQIGKIQLEKNKLEINQLIRRKHKLQEEMKEQEDFFNSKEQSLLEELNMLRNFHRSRESDQFQIGVSGRQGAFDGVASNSLQEQLEPEPNWFQLYENALQKHNKFIRQVHYLLKKQQRKQSCTLDDIRISKNFSR